MADVSDFALTACTGISVLSFYQPREWELFRTRVLGGFAFFAAACFGSMFIIDQGGGADMAHLVPKLRSAGEACLGIFAWGGFMQWLTRGRDANH